VQAFEPRLTAVLHARWPDRVGEVIAYEERQGWLLLADAGIPLGRSGNPPEAWLAFLPSYAELQRGETPHASEHLANGVPDGRLGILPALYEDLTQRALPLERDEVERLRAFAGRFAELCAELGSHAIPETVQHDDLHMGNLYADRGGLRLLDWGDASISHPFASLVVTFRFLEERTLLAPYDRWFGRLRDAYLEPWDSPAGGVFELALRVGAFAHACAWLRQRDHLPDGEQPQFDRGFAVVLRRALGEMADSQTRIGR
jgi:hypothetical protein